MPLYDAVINKNIENQSAGAVSLSPKHGAERPPTSTATTWLNRREVFVWAKGIYAANVVKLCAAATEKVVPSQKTRRSKNRWTLSDPETGIKKIHLVNCVFPAWAGCLKVPCAFGLLFSMMKNKRTMS